MLLSMGAISIVGMYSYNSAQSAQMARTYDQLASVKYLKKKQVEAFYAERVDEVLSLTRDPALSVILHKKTYSGVTKLFSPLLKNIIGSHGFYSRIILLRDNHIYSSYFGPGSLFKEQTVSEDLKTDSIFRLAVNMKRPFISDLFPHDSGTGWSQLIIVPVNNQDNKQIAAIGLELFSTAIDSIMPDNNPLNGLGKSGEAYLVGKDRFLRSSSRFIPNSILRARIDTSTARLAFSGSDGTWLLNDYRGTEVLGAFSQLSPSYPYWAIIAEIDMHEAMIPIISIRNNIIFITVFIAVVVFFATWLLSRKITKPIIKLQKAAQKLGRGNLGTHVEVDTNDEIGELAESFNQMSDKLMENEDLLKKERARRMRAAFDGQDTERHRLSRELHDGLGQSLIAQKLRLEAIGLTDTEKAMVSLQEMKKCSDQLVDEVRRISNALMPAQLTQFGLIPALKQHCDEVSGYSGIEVSFDSTGNFDMMSRKAKTYLFRIIQEALNNIVKHAGASTASVEIAQTREHIFLSINDNGKGFNTENGCSGNGINNMRERTSLLGGNFTIFSQTAKGTTIEIQLPSIR